MKIYRLLLVLFIACCSWMSATAQCNAHPTIQETHLPGGGIALSIAPNGARAPFHSILWQSTFRDRYSTTDTAFYSGVYRVSFADSLNCSYFITDTFFALPCAPASVVGLYIRDTITANGIIGLTAGTAAHYFSYEWSTGINSFFQPLPGAVSGQVYCVTVTDAITNCTASICDTTCTFSGTVTDSIASPYNYFSLHPAVTLPYYQMVWNGVYHYNPYRVADTTHVVTLSALDGNGCSYIDTFYPHPCQLTDTFLSTHDAFNHYTLQAHVANSTAPVSYAWSINGYSIPSATGSTLSDSLAQGSYVICSSVRDATTCSAQRCDTIVVAAPLLCRIGVGLSDTLIGTAHYVVSSMYDYTAGATSQTYHWSSGSTQMNDSVIAGVHIYCLTVTDNVGCSASNCINTCTLTGSATATTFGNGWNQHAIVNAGTAPYHYLWSSGDTTASFYTTTRGVYYVTITDSRGCSIVATDTAGSICYLAGTLSMVSNNSTRGVIKVSIYNNQGRVTYHWPAYTTTVDTLVVINSGRYCVTATDTSGCSVTLCDTFTVGCHLTASITDSMASNGYTLTAHADSGQAPYTYYWNGLNNPAGSSSIFTPANGQHCVTITDHSGCSATACDSIHLPCTLAVSIADSNYGSNHVLTAIRTGGAWQVWPPYTWTNSSGTMLSHASYYIAQATGRYCVQVSDTNGCTASACDSVHLGCNLVTSLSETHTAANVYTFTTANTGGTGQYTYGWYIDQVFHYAGPTYVVTFTPGTHLVWVMVTDSVTHCTDSAQLYFTVPVSGCTLSASVTHVVTASQATLTAHAAGAHGPVTYSWTGGSTGATLVANHSGGYCVTIRDSAGCTDNICDTITLIGCSLHAAYTSSHSGNTYVFTGAATGALGSATYQWRIDNGTTYTGARDTVLLTAGIHNVCVYVRDSGACRDTFCQAITVTSTTCSLGGYIKDSVVHLNWIGNTHYYVPVLVNGTAPYTYHWSNGSTGAYVYSGFWQSAFTGTVTVTDAGGCTAVLHMNSAYVDTFCGNVFSDLNGNGVQNAGEAGVSGQIVSLYSGSTLVTSVTTNAYGHYAIAVHPGTYTIRYNAGTSYAITIPLNTTTTPNSAQYGPFVISSNANNYCGYNFGIRTTNVTITGYVYLDANNNGTYDAGETPVVNQAVHVGPHVVYTNTSGQYTYTGAAGTYAITYVPSSVYAAYTVVPGSRTVNASTAGTTYGGNNFGLQQHTTACNIATTIIPITTITAGYPSWYYVYVSNYGTNVASGTMTFYYDPALAFDHASPLQASVNATAHTVSFVYAGLQPGTYTTFVVYFTANTNVTVGQSTFEMATATDNCIESNFADNTDTLHQIATGSWDPNAKTVTPAGEGAQGLIHRDQELRYTINFQNTGTAPAVNVVLRDSIAATLDPSTIRVLGSSHPDYVVQVEGQELICRYSQIMLPDSFSNEAQSHGFLSFAISPLAGLSDGTQIQNTASIFFDYNDAVVTNTTLNTVDYTLSVKDVIGGATITVQPNPMSTYTTIRVTGADMHDATLDVYDALGQLAGTATPSAEGVFTLQRNGLAAGIYSYHIRQSSHTIGSGKLVIE